MKIIIIEDEVLLAKLMKRKLVDNGYKVDIFNTMQDFIDNYTIADLYITDIHIGKDHGQNIVKHIRRKTNNPILIISGSFGKEEANKCLKRGANKYLPKPFLPSTFLKEINKLLTK